MTKEKTKNSRILSYISSEKAFVKLNLKSKLKNVSEHSEQPSQKFEKENKHKSYSNLWKKRQRKYEASKR